MAAYTFEIDGVISNNGGSDTTGLFGNDSILSQASLNSLPYTLTITLVSLGALPTGSSSQSVLASSNNLPRSITLSVGGDSYTWNSLQSASGSMNDTLNDFATVSVGGQVPQTDTVTGVQSEVSFSASANVETDQGTYFYNKPGVSLNNSFSYALAANDQAGVGITMPGPTGGFVNISVSGEAVKHFSITTTAQPTAGAKPKPLWSNLDTLAKISTLGFAYGASFAKGGTPLAILLNSMTLLTGAADVVFDLLKGDPPDNNYATIATPVTPTVSTAGLSANVAAGVTALAQLVGLGSALDTTYNRLSTAYSDGNGYWEQQQTAAYQSYETQAAAAAAAYAQAIPAIAAYANGAGTETSVTAAAIAKFQGQQSASALSASLAASATSLGLDATTQQAIAALIAQDNPTQAASLVSDGYDDTDSQAELGTLANSLQADVSGATAPIQNAVTVSGAGSVLGAISGFDNIEVITGQNANAVVFVTPGYQAASVSGATPVTVLDSNGGVLLSAGTGNATLLSSASADTLQAGAGSDVLVSFSGDALESAAGESGDNLFFGGSAPVTIQGGAGNDTAIMSAGGSITTGTGGSQIWLSAGSSVIDSNGADTIVGGGGAATVSVSGSAGVLAFGGSGTILFNGGAGASTVVGVSGSVTVNGGSGGGAFFGGTAGDNVLQSGAGQTTLIGGGNGDVLGATGAANDILAASGGAETLNGAASSGDDAFFGGLGGDCIIGGTGSNVFTAGPGNMTFAGGGTTDLYVFLAGATSKTVIDGFNPAHDFIKLSGFASGADKAAFNGAGAQGANTLITLGDGTQITLVGIAPSTLSVGNFV